MFRRRSLLFAATILMLGGLAALVAPAAQVNSQTGILAAAPTASHDTVWVKLGALLWPVHLYALVPAKKAARHPAPVAPVRIKASGNGSGESAAGTNRHHAPVSVIGNPHAALVA
jgi:hypothetical protein